VLQGVGVVVPIFATYDLEADTARLYFYDAMGRAIRGDRLRRDGSGIGSSAQHPLLREHLGEKAAAQAEAAGRGGARPARLDTAAEADTATGGVDRRGRIFPIVKLITASGISTLDEAELAEVFKETVA
jgi:proteasome beta subunit